MNKKASIPAAMPTLDPPEQPRSKPQPRWYRRLALNLGLGAEEKLRDTLTRAIEDQSDGAQEFSTQERLMLLNTLRFGGLRVSDVMVPRVDVVAISEDASAAGLLRLFSEAGHSRIPVYRETLDDPQGMVHIKDLMSWIAKSASRGPANGGADGLHLQEVDMTAPISSIGIVREVLFVPPSMPAVDLLLRMQTTHIHLALVVDEYGGTDGLVSIEDLVEEIVGDIEDEHDIDEIPPIRRDAHGLVASARTPLEDIERDLDLKLCDPETDEDVDTLGGLLFAMAGRVPPRGHVIHHPSGVDFEILEATPRRIGKVRIIRRPNGGGSHDHDAQGNGETAGHGSRPNGSEPRVRQGEGDGKPPARPLPDAEAA